MINKDKKRKILKALKHGASESQLFREGITHWDIYVKIPKSERDMAKAKHDTIIRGIFES